MNPTDPSPEKGKSRQPKPPSTPSEPAERAVAPWELAGLMTDQQRKEFAKRLVALLEESEARKASKAAHPPAK